MFAASSKSCRRKAGAANQGVLANRSSPGLFALCWLEQRYFGLVSGIEFKSYLLSPIQQMKKTW